MKSQDNKINNVRLSSTQQNTTHHIHYNNEYSNHPYKYNKRMRQITQKAISAKVNADLFLLLEEYCNKYNQKRNRIINQSIEEFLINHPVG